MAVDKNNRPDFKNYSWQNMSEAWNIVRTAKSGTLALRAAGQQFLPAFPAEQKYPSRLSTAVFYNFYQKVVSAATGLVFQKDIMLGEDVPKIIKIHGENIDNAGTHISVFAKEVFKKSFDGHCFITVDAAQTGGNIKTLADERKAGLRPYWSVRSASDALNWRTQIIAGELVLTQITFKEVTSEADGEFGETEITRYRVWQLVETKQGIKAAWKIYREIKDKNEQTTFVIDSSGVTKLNKIPVSVVYGEKTGVLESRPPLLDMALLNIKHYQQSSDYHNTLHLAGMPILWAKELDTKSETVPIGVDVLIKVGKDGAIGFAEPSGASLTSARTALEDLKREMEALAFSLVSAKKTQVTATEAALSSIRETSDLATMARSLQDSLEQALYFHAQYLGLPDGGSIELGVDLNDLVLNSEDIRLLSDLQQRGQITLETLLWNLQRGDKLQPDKSIDDELLSLTKSKETQMPENPSQIGLN